jgi:acetate---CoA ligase (ADP-forming)
MVSAMFNISNNIFNMERAVRTGGRLSARATLGRIPALTNPIRKMLCPRSVVVLGASADFNKLSGRAVKALIDRKFGGPVYPVNPKYNEIGGFRCYADIADLPETADLAIIALPGEQVATALRKLAKAGTKTAVIFSSGFREIGEKGVAADDALRVAIRETGIRALGPNCLGYYNAHDNAYATFSQITQDEVPPGPAALISQSGALATTTAGLARRRGFGFAQLVATGNEIDITTADVMDVVVDNPRVKVVSCFAEGIRDGRKLISVAKKAMDAAKPLVLCKVGRTDAGARAVASHTGALAGETKVFEGVAAQYGIVRARSDEQLLNYTIAFANCPLPRGNRLGILTRSGGAGAIMADRAQESGMELAVLTDATRDNLAEILPAFASVANPVDMTAQGVVDQGMIGKALMRLLADPNVDVVTVWIGLTKDEAPLMKAFSEVAASSDKPVCICWAGASSDALKTLGETGVALFPTPESAVDTASVLCKYAADLARWREQSEARSRQAEIAPVELALEAGVIGTVTATEILAAAGVNVVAAHLARTPDEAAALAGKLGFPVALKIESPDILHKTEAGGVRLDLRDADAVRAAAVEVMEAAHSFDGKAQIDGVVLQPMSAGGVEVAIGVRRDPVFGPVVMAALGGIFVEVLKDAAFRAAPVTTEEALGMLDSLRGRALLDGVRGSKAVDRAKLAGLISAVSRFAVASGSRLDELDLNPVFASADDAIAVDTLLVLGAETPAAPTAVETRW